MAINQDYKDLFKLFNQYKVQYLVAGAYAVIFYTEPRYTKDIDIWINPTPLNAKRAWNALKEFGAPLKDISVNDLCNSHMIYQIGVEPNRIDILMGIPGLEFQSAWEKRQKTKYDNVNISIINIEHLIKAKKTANRPQDNIDLKRLETIKSSKVNKLA
jgi:hypothetical protein